MLRQAKLKLQRVAKLKKKPLRKRLLLQRKTNKKRSNKPYRFKSFFCKKSP